MCIIPAIIPQSEDHVRSAVKVVDGAVTEIQIDLVDGIFAGQPSWPFSVTPASRDGEIKKFCALVRELSQHISVEVDLMVEEPRELAACVVEAGAKRLVIHAESTQNMEEYLVYRDRAKVGLAITSDSPFEPLRYFGSRVDFIQCMGIVHIGAQGNPFDYRIIERIKDVRILYPEIEIAVDGAVSPFTLPLIKGVGATRFIVGSAIFGQEEPLAALARLKELAHQ